MIRLTPYRQYSDAPDNEITYIDPAEIAALESYTYHSFRRAICKITLQSGKEIIVWESVDTVQQMMADAVWVRKQNTRTIKQ